MFAPRHGLVFQVAKEVEPKKQKAMGPENGGQCLWVSIL